MGEGEGLFTVIGTKYYAFTIKGIPFYLYVIDVIRGVVQKHRGITLRNKFKRYLYS